MLSWKVIPAVVLTLVWTGAAGPAGVNAAPGDPTPGPTRTNPCAAVLAGDFDGDTLSNYRECQLGTNPFYTILTTTA